MRAGLSTIQQTLTADSASVLNRSIAEAARRSHGQTTPLHVAATLLAAPTGLLRQACIRSHPASSHPLQCRALELCFTVALDRLPSNANSTKVTDPPISNALMAALKRAQAHQRRGCPEQQQQPLLAVKVELEQLIISVLDDPSVSRVMREASFSSPAVKATIEHSLSSSPSNSSAAASPPATPVQSAPEVVPPPTQNLYLNPRLHHQQPTATTNANGEQMRKDEPQRVLDIMVHTKKRNPVVVSDCDPVSIMREVLKRIAAGEAPPPIRAANVITADVADSDRSTILTKIKNLGSLVEARIGDGSGRGVILDLGDLKWLVETPGGGAVSNPIQQQQQQQQLVSETGRSAVAEITKIIQRFAESGRLWVVATASCATYLRCQVYHPAMDADWDLQALPVAPRTPFPVLFSRHGGNGILSSSVESLAPPRGFPVLGTTGILRRPVDGTEVAKTKLCALCIGSYEKELAVLVTKKLEKSSAESRSQCRPALPHWMKPVNNNLDEQIQSKPQEHAWKQSTEELLKNWREKCSQLHPTLNPSSTFPPRRPLQPRLSLSQSTTNATNATTQPFRFLSMAEHRPRSPPGSPVQTELVLGPDNAHRDRVKDYTACKLNQLSDRKGDSFDSFKRLYKGLADRVGWQPAAATAVATAVTQCKSSKPRGTAWLMFVGPDKVGKKKMAAAISDLVFGAVPVIVSLVADNTEPAGVRGRGMTSVNRISDAVRRNPFSVVVLEGFDRADLLVTGTIRRAIESGRMLDSQGREVSLESAIFVLNTNWLPEELKNTHDSNLKCEEERILSSANCGWQLEFSVSDRIGKRGADCSSSSARPAKLRKESCGGGGLSLDLNLAAGMDDDTGEGSGSLNSSELTVEDSSTQVSVRLGLNSECATNSPAAELIKLVDGAIEFKPVDFSPIRRMVLESIYAIFGRVIGNGKVVRVDEDALDIIVGGVWLAGAGVDSTGFEEWADRVLVPSLQQLSTSNVMAREGLVIARLSAVKDPRRPQWAEGLPSRVSIAGV